MNTKTERVPHVYILLLPSRAIERKIRAHVVKQMSFTLNRQFSLVKN